jgi:hypothetical protein
LTNIYRYDEPGKIAAREVLDFLYGDRSTWIVNESKLGYDLVHYVDGVQYDIEVGVKTKWLDRRFNFTTVHVEMRKALNPRDDKLLMYINNPILSDRISFVILPSNYTIGAADVVVNGERMKDIPCDLPGVKFHYTNLMSRIRKDHRER